MPSVRGLCHLPVWIGSAMTDSMDDLVRKQINVRVLGVPLTVPLMTKVEEGFWFGGLPSRPVPFDYVLDLYGERPIVGQPNLRVVPFPDNPLVPIPDDSEGLAAWVNEKRAKGTVYVHCAAGINRSAFIVVLSLVRRGLDARQVIADLRARRHKSILCNTAFERYLLEIET